MVKTKTTYEGGLHCSMVHEPSGATLSTDAPVDNNGKGESFSPTDLVGAALAGCMSTIMGIVAERKGINLEGMTVEVAKHMNADPRRIGKLEVVITVPPSVRLSGQEAAGTGCSELSGQAQPAP